jgi:Ca2+-binding RTX toxin-like protein
MTILANSLESWEYFASYGDLRNWAMLDGVLNAADSANAATHYNLHAAAEGRTIIFDAWEYLASNVDLINWLGADGITAQDAITAAQHYIAHGAGEGRSWHTFDSATYLAANADLQAWYNGLGYTAAQALDAAAQHYIVAGRFEGRPGTPESTYELKNIGDVVSAYNFHSAPTYTPGGNDYINTLQNSDYLTGLGSHATLTALLDNRNDNGGIVIAPHLSHIETVNVEFRNTGYYYTGEESVLDLQDSDHALKNVNVTAVSTRAFLIENLHIDGTGGGATNLSVANSHATPDIAFTYLNQELTGTNDTVSLTLTNVYADNLVLGSNHGFSYDGFGSGFYSGHPTEQVEHFNLIANGDPSVNLVDLLPDQRSLTSQTLNITANSELILGYDYNGHLGEVPAVPTVLDYPADPAQQSAGHLFPSAGVAGHDLSYIEHDYAFTFDTAASLSNITITGSGNVTLSSVGHYADFVLNGAAATGDIAVNISNSAADPLATFTTGHGNDTVLVDQILLGFGGSGTGIYGDNVTLAGKVYTGDGNDVVLAHDLQESFSNPLYRTVIDTGSGDDTVVVGTLFGGPGQAGTSDYNGPLITLGAGNDSVTSNNLQEEARIDAGAGNDIINLTTTYGEDHGTGVFSDVYYGYTVVAGDSTGLNADGHGAEVLAGAGDDHINFLFTGTGLGDLDRYSVIEGYVDGGSGSDIITVNSNKDLDLVDGLSTKIDDTTITKAITGVETLTLNSTTAWSGIDGSNGGLDRAGDFNNLLHGTRTITANDDNGQTADYLVHRSQFDSALTTINLNHQDGVILNIAHEHLADYVAFAGDDAVDTLDTLLGTEQINLTALETYTNEGAGYGASGELVTGTGAAADTLGTVYGAGDVHSVCDVVVPFTADLTVNLSLASGTGTGVVAHVAILDNPTTSIYSDLRAATTVLNSDFSINDAGSGGNRYEAIALAVSGNHNHGIDLNNDFHGNLTLTGSGTTAGGNLTIINIGAPGTGDYINGTGSVVNTAAYDGNVYLGIDSSVNHTVISGAGNDIVRLGDDSAISLGNDFVNLGSGNDIVVFNGLGTGSVNHAGLSNGDSVIGGAGYDTLAIGGQTTTLGYGVVIAETELQLVSGFEAIQFSVGQAEPNYYYLALADSAFDQNGVSTNNVLLPTDKVIDIVNNNLSEYNLLADHNNSLALGSGHWTQLGMVSESDLVINLLEVGIHNQITYSGATNAEGSGDCIVDHGSKDRIIFNDGNLDGFDTINGGAHDGDGTTVKNQGALHDGGAYDELLGDIQSFYTHFSSTGSGLGNSDVIEIRNNAEVIARHDLANVKNIGTIVFNNSISSSAQTLIMDMTDRVVDAMVDSLHTASTVAGERETLVIIANDGTVDQNHAAQLFFDGSSLTAKSELFIQLDDQDYGPHLSDGSGDGTGSTLEGGVFGYDNILGGAGNDYINGVTGNYLHSGDGDTIDGGAGTGDTIGFTTYFSDFGNDQIKNVEIIDVWHDVNHDPLSALSDNISVDLTLQDEAFTINVHAHHGTFDGHGDGAGNILVAGNGDDTIHIYDFNASVDGHDGNDTISVDGSGNQSSESISGGSGNDYITGGSGADHIWGDSGNDTLIGGVGQDTLTGGAGNDHFRYEVTPVAADHDTIQDFVSGSDKLVFKESAFILNGGVDWTGGHALTTTTDHNNYAETSTALSGSAQDLNGTDGNIGSHQGFVVVGANSGSAGVDVFYTTEIGAAMDTNSTLIAHLVGINTTQIDANDFLGY